MKNYQVILRNILAHLKDSEKKFLMNVLDEELKRIRREDIVLKEEKTPRKLFYINRDWYDVTTETLRAFSIIKNPVALETPLQSLNYLINNISNNKETVLAIRFLAKCFDAETGEADVIVEQIDKIIFKTTNYEFFSAEILSLLIEVNYGSQTSKGLKYFKNYDKKVFELRRILRKFRRTPLQDVYFINRKLLTIVNTEIRRNSLRENRNNLELLNELKTEIENIQN